MKVDPVTGDVYASGSSLAYGPVIRKRSAGAAEFATVYASGANDGGSGWSIGFHPDGRVHVAGWAYSTRTQRRHWIVRSSHDGGVTWTISDDFNLGGFTLEVSGMALDPAGNIHVCGQVEDEAGQLFWIVRQGTPQIFWNEQAGAWATSLTWSTIDLFQVAPGQPARANDIAADARGNVFVNGRGADADGVDHWLVRKWSGAGPRLSVRRVPDGLQLAWSAKARDFRLESASTLTDGGDWQGMDLLPAPTSSHSVMAVEVTNPAAFFRLRQR
ncbi:MAG: hypothetical protein KJ072_06360 [Verrucomicrobia bacterium]|nr:hypothetical protein [Verrucomicrobiota bacterium]